MLAGLKDVVDPSLFMFAAVGTPHEHGLSTHQSLLKTNKFNIPGTRSQLEV